MHESGPETSPIAASSVRPAGLSLHTQGVESPSDAPAGHRHAAPISNASTATLADGSVRALDPAWPRVDAVSWWVTTAVISIPALIVIIVLWIGEEIEWPMLAVISGGWAVITALLILGSTRWPQLAYRHTRYIVTPLGIEIRHGVIWRSVTSVPRSRVQHTDVTQGPLMRRSNLATLVMHTAGTQHALVTLPGLPFDVAVQLRDFLIRGGDAAQAHAVERSADAV